MRWVLMSLSITVVFSVPGWCADPGAQTYTGYYTGKIIPTPKEAEYLDDAWELADCAAQTTAACILTSEAPSHPESIAAQEIQARIKHLSGGIEVPICKGTKWPKGTKTFIALDVAGKKGFVAHHMALCKTPPPDKPEGYVITPYRHKEKFSGVFLVGQDGAGAYFGAQSLVQLIDRAEDKVVLHPAKVKDWPTFRLRSFKGGGDRGEGSHSWDMGLWSALAKFNCYNICYTTVGRDKWVDPEPDYREHVQALTRYMRARGLDTMPFVNPYYLWKEHIEVSDPGDLDKLFEACRIGPEAGGTRVMLCLDDFASKPEWSSEKLYKVRSEKDREAFDDDLAAVNIAMINDLNRRLPAAYPHAQLYVVLPYYWNPRPPYQAAGEEYLKKEGAGIDDSVRIVWTGPRVRSGTIVQAHIDYYQGLLGGRQVMLWDNTIYMHHNPPHYFLDTFHTQYPDRFSEQISGEVHLNAGTGEAYKCGLLAAADYLWNPQAYDPETSLRNAIAAVAGPASVDDLLAFRDAYYTIYDDFAAQFGKPEALLKLAKTMQERHFDETWIEEARQLLRDEASLADKIAATCPNAGLVGEVRSRVERHAAYQEAFDLLAALPPIPEAETANLAPNPGAEVVSQDRPAEWATYTGAGAGTLGLAEGHSGQHAAKLTTTVLHDWQDGRKSINVALMIGDCNGFDGPRAPELLPLHQYFYSFWLKGDAPRVVVSCTTWDKTGNRKSRGLGRTKLEPFAATDEWTLYTGSFITPPDAARGALKIGIEGFLDEGAGLGEILVDDVYVGRSREKAEQGARGE